MSSRSSLFATSAALAAACCFALPAHAVDPTDIPLNSQIGSLRIPYKCSFPVIGAQTLNVKLTGSMATEVGPGQPFYMTDGSGVLEFPQALSDLMYDLLGVRSASGSITELNFALKNATPAVINGLTSPIVISGLQVEKGKPIALNLPASGFMQVGPLYASTNPGQVLVKVGTAKGSLKLYTKSGGQILWDLGVACKAPSPEIIVLGMTVAGAPSTEVSAPHTNIRTEDLDTPFMTQSGSLRFPLSCTVQGLGRRTLSATFTGTAPALYAPGEVFNAATNGYGTLRVPGAVVDELRALHPGAAKLGGTIDKLEFSSTNTVPSGINLAATPLTAQTSPLLPGQDAVVRIPDSGFLTVGPFKAALTGATDTALYVGRTAGAVHVSDAAGTTLGSHRVDCDLPDPAVTMVSVTIGGKAVYPAKVSGVSPSSGKLSGGTTVVVFGSNFNDARQVFFGDTPAASFKVEGSGLISAVAPAHAAGTLQITVQGVGGTEASSKGVFTYK